MINQFNRNSNCVITSIVTEENTLKRAEVLNYWITVVEELYKLNNFNGMCVVIASLSSSSVFRLKETWKKIDKKKLLNYSDTCKIISTDSASKVYREHLLKCNPPLVPHLGLYLQDLTFIEDGNPLFLENNLVNFVKCRMIGAQILTMISYQKTPYNLQIVPEIRDFFMNADTMTEGEQYSLSTKREPRRNK